MIKKHLLALILLLALPVAASGATRAAVILKLDSKAASMKEAGVGPVKFTHGRHANRAKCSRCHPKIFKKKRGASGINMRGNMEGRFCGACHNGLTKTFPLYPCTHCHTNVTGPKRGR